MNSTLENLKNKLLRQQKKVEDDIKSLEDDDPVMENALAEASEPGTDYWLADTHSRVVAVKQSLIDMLYRTKDALVRIKTGNFGKCENCGKQIEPERLEVMPTATLCIACSKLPAKARSKGKKKSR